MHAAVLIKPKADYRTWANWQNKTAKPYILECWASQRLDRDWNDNRQPSDAVSCDEWNRSCSADIISLLMIMVLELDYSRNDCAQ